MSTRCCVKVVKKFNDDNVKEVMIYHHHDGYPEGVGADLVNRSKEKWDKYANGWDIDLIVNDLVKDTDEEYEITCYNHVDIEYLYTIDCDNKDIKCNVARWDMQEKDGEYISQSIIEEEVAIPGYKEEKDIIMQTVEELGHKAEKTDANTYEITIVGLPNDGTETFYLHDLHTAVDDMERIADDFDPDEYVIKWIKGDSKHPSVRALLEDADAIKKEMTELAIAFKKAVHLENTK